MICVKIKREKKKHVSREHSSRKKIRLFYCTFLLSSSSISNSDEERIAKRNKKRKKKRYWKKWRSSASSSDKYFSVNCFCFIKSSDNCFTVNRFCIVNLEEQFKRKLWADMAEYGDKHVNIFTQEKVLKDSILMKNHATWKRWKNRMNLCRIFWRKKKTESVIYYKFQRRNLGVTEPLSKVHL